MPVVDDRLRSRRTSGGRSGVITLDELIKKFGPPRQPVEIKAKAEDVGGWRGFVSEAFENPILKYGVLKPLEVLDTGRRGIISGAREFVDFVDSDPNTNASFEDFKAQTRDVTFGFGTAFPDPTGNAWLDRSIGFIGDVGLDPLTYVTFGAGAAARKGVFAAGREGRNALARKVALTVAERSGSSVDEAVLAAARREGGAAGRQVAQNGIAAARRVLTPEEAARIGVPKAGAYMFGKHIRKGRPLRIPGSGVVGEMADVALSRMRLAAAGTRVGGRIQRATTPEALRDTRIALARGTLDPEQAWEAISEITSQDAFRSTMVSSSRRAADELTKIARETGIDQDAALRSSVFKYLEGAPTTSATPRELEAVTRIQAHLDTLWGELDGALKAVDPTGGIGFVRRYYPHVLTDDAWKWIDEGRPGSDSIKSLLKSDDLNPETAFNPRKLHEGSVFFGQKLTADDLNVERLNQIARERGGVPFDFFEQDIARALDKYGREWGRQMGKVAIFKHMAEDGLLSSQKLKLVMDEDAAKAALRDLDEAVKAESAARTVVDGAVQQAHDGVLAHLEQLTKAIDSAMAARLGNAKAATINVIDTRAALQAAKKTLEEARAMAGSTKGLVEILQQQEVAFADFFVESQQKIVDGLAESLAVVDAAIDAEQAIRLATLDGDLALAQQMFEDISARAKQALADQKRLSLVHRDVIEFNAWLGENYEKIIAGDVYDVPKLPKDFLEPRFNAVVEALDPRYEGPSAQKLAEGGASGKLGEFLLGELDREGSIVNSLLGGSGAKRGLLEKLSNKDMDDLLDRVMLAEASPTETLHAVAAYLGKVVKYWGGEDKIPDILRGRFTTLVEHGQRLRTAHIFQRISEKASTKNPEWFAVQRQKWSSLSTDLADTYDELVLKKAALEEINTRIAATERRYDTYKGIEIARGAMDWELDGLYGQHDDLVAAIRSLETSKFSLNNNEWLSAGEAYSQDVASLEWALDWSSTSSPGMQSSMDWWAVQLGLPAKDLENATGFQADLRARIEQLESRRRAERPDLVAIQAEAAKMREGWLAAGLSQKVVDKRVRLFVNTKMASLRRFSAEDLPEVKKKIRDLDDAEMAATLARGEEGASKARVRTGQNKGSNTGAHVSTAALHGEGMSELRRAAMVDLEEFRMVSEVAARADFLERRMNDVGITISDRIIDDIMQKVRGERMRFWTDHGNIAGELALKVRDAWAKTSARIAETANVGAEVVKKVDQRQVKALVDEMFEGLKLSPDAKRVLAAAHGGDRFAATAQTTRRNLQQEYRAAKARAAFDGTAENKAELAAVKDRIKNHEREISRWFKQKFPAYKIKGSRPPKKTLDGALQAAGGLELRNADAAERTIQGLLVDLKAEIATSAQMRRAIGSTLGDPDATFSSALDEGFLARQDTPTAKLVVTKMRIERLEEEIAEALADKEKLGGMATESPLVGKARGTDLDDRWEKSKLRARALELMDLRQQLSNGTVRARTRLDQRNLLQDLADVDGWKLTSDDWRSLGMGQPPVDTSPARRARVQLIIEAELAQQRHAPFIQDGSVAGGYRMVRTADEVPDGEPLFRRTGGEGAPTPENPQGRTPIEYVQVGIDNPDEADRLLAERERLTGITRNLSTRAQAAKARLESWTNLLRHMGLRPGEIPRSYHENGLKDLMESLRAGGKTPFPLDPEVAALLGREFGSVRSVDVMRKWNAARLQARDAAKFERLGGVIDPNSALPTTSPMVEAIEGYTPSAGNVFSEAEWTALYVPPKQRAKIHAETGERLSLVRYYIDQFQKSVDGYEALAVKQGSNDWSEIQRVNDAAASARAAVADLRVEEAQLVTKLAATTADTAEAAWKKFTELYGAAVMHHGDDFRSSGTYKHWLSMAPKSEHATRDQTTAAARRAGATAAYEQSTSARVLRGLADVDEEITTLMGRRKLSPEALQGFLDDQQRRFNDMHWSTRYTKNWDEAARERIGKPYDAKYGGRVDNVDKAAVRGQAELEGAQYAAGVYGSRIGTVRGGAVSTVDPQIVAERAAAVKGAARRGRLRARLEAEKAQAVRLRNSIKRERGRAAKAPRPTGEQDQLVTKAIADLEAVKAEGDAMQKAIIDNAVALMGAADDADALVARAELVVVDAAAAFDQADAIRWTFAQPDLAERLLRSKANHLSSMVNPEAGRTMLQQMANVAAFSGVLGPNDPLTPMLLSAISAEADLLAARGRVAEAMFNPKGIMKWATELEKGFVSLEEWGLPGMQANPRVKEVMDNFRRANNSAVAVELSKFLGWYTKRFKAYATAMPGFHVRNAMSNTFSVFAAGGEIRNMWQGEKLYQGWLTARKQGTMDAFEASVGAGWPAFKAALQIADAAGGGQQLEALADILGSSKRIDNNWILRGHRRASERIEGSARFMLAYDSVMKGMDLSSGAARVRRFLFDYAPEGRSSLDNSMAQIVPFWTWMSRNFPLQIINRWSNPRAYAIYNNLMRNIGEPTGDDDPQYLREQGARSIGGEFFLSPDVGFNRMNETLEQLKDPTRLLSDVNPILRVPAELMGGRRLYNNSEFTSRPQQVAGGPAAPALQALLGMLGQTQPVSRPGQGMQVGETATNAKANYAALNLIPPLNQLERLFPATDAYKDRHTGSLLSWLGIPARQAPSKP